MAVERGRREKKKRENVGNSIPEVNGSFQSMQVGNFYKYIICNADTISYNLTQLYEEHANTRTYL